MEARPGWREEFNRWSFTNALLPLDSPLIPALEDKEAGENSIATEPRHC